MIKEIKKGNKASYNGYLLGIHEYEDYKKLKAIMPKVLQTIQELRGEHP